MFINSYKLKESTTINDLLKDGFNYSVDCKYLSRWITLGRNIALWIKVSLKDFSATIEVLDDSFGQYYIPFYEYKNGEIKDFKLLNQIIEKYNNEMNNLGSFELNI